MGMEIEAKMRVADFTPLLQQLRAAGAKAKGEVFETNIFFDTAKGELRRAGKGLRLRANRKARTGKTEHVVTVKGPLRSGKLKSRPESEFVVDDPKALIEAFGQLGFKVSLKFQKRRNSFSLGGCKIELDELPRLGKFVEIEGPGIKAVMKMRAKLRLQKHPLVRRSYAEMLADELKRRKIATRSVEFGEK